jgi:glutathione S-transferase
MSSPAKLTLYYAPNTRAAAVATLLEELGAPYERRILDLAKGEQRRPDYLAIHPMGKVPAVADGDQVITELVAIFLHLADRFPDKHLAPAIGDAARGPYLRWMVYYNSCFEPALMDKAQNNPPPPPARCSYRDFETMLDVLCAQLAKGPCLLGERFSAADILWTTALGWTTQWKLVPERPEIMAYLARQGGRPAAKKIQDEDADLAAKQKAEGDGAPPAT